MSRLRASSPLAPSSSSPTPPNGVPPATPSNSQIEAVIQMATSAAAPDARVPGRDTRTQLFVGNLPYRVRWQDLKDLFRKAGTVLRADVSLGPDNRSRGYGTVLLATSEDAARAVDMFNGYNWQTRTLEVRPDRLPPDFDAALSVTPAAAQPSMPLPPPYGTGDGPLSVSGPDDLEVSPLLGRVGSKSLFVGNLPFHCQWQDLKDLFRQAGTIVRADVALGPDGRSRGFGTVSFANDTDAERALAVFNGYEYNGRTLKVHYDKYSQGQSSQSPIPIPSLPLSNPPQVPHAHPNAPSHISLPMPPPLTAFEQFISGHQSPSPYEHPFGQISPYDIYPPHIAAIAGNAAAQAYMNNRPRTPPGTTSEPVAASKPWSPLLPPSDSATDSGPSLQTTTENTDAPATTASKPPPPSLPPAHPGPIALPSPSIHAFPHASGPVSPLQGLPPITPSMPTFTFVPQNATPPLNAHFLSPGIGLSPFSPPGTMSPGSFYHPASNQRHPMGGGGGGAGGGGHVWNLAPGAPVQVHSPPALGSPGSPGYYTMHAQQGGAPLGSEGFHRGVGGGASPHVSMGGDYFSVPVSVPEGYFPPVAVMRGSSGLVNEVMQEREGADAGEEGGGMCSKGGGGVAESGCDEGAVEVDMQAMERRVGCMALESGAPAPHRTRSDGDEAAGGGGGKAPSGLGLGVNGDVASWGHRGAAVGERVRRDVGPSESWGHAGGGAMQQSVLGGGGERRASWTPEASRGEFRRGLAVVER